jgi:hypothetical protein
MKVTLDKTFNFKVHNYAFGDLTRQEAIECYKDGRVASHFLERQLTKWFPELTHIKGCKDHDHVDGSGNKYDAKNFTPSGGLKFKPSAMLGSGRSFNAEVAHAKAENMIYICCDIVDFPAVRVIFKSGKDLIAEYPKCEIPKRHREVLFG